MGKETAAEFIERKTRQWKRDREQGRAIKTKDVGRQGHHLWLRECWTWQVQHNLPQKVIVLERWRYLRTVGARANRGGAKPGDIEYRIGYWTIAHTGRARGRWWWGQYSPLIPHVDLGALLKKAKNEKTLLTRVSRGRSR